MRLGDCGIPWEGGGRWMEQIPETEDEECLEGQKIGFPKVPHAFANCFIWSEWVEHEINERKRKRRRKVKQEGRTLSDLMLNFS